MANHTFLTHLLHLSYVTAQGTFVSIPGTLVLDSSTHPELVKELTAIAQDPNSPIYMDAATAEATKEAQAATQLALVAEMRAKAAAATAADKAGK